MSCDVMVVAGTRPELIKLAPVFWELQRRGISYVFVWSGQHYDYEMSRVFIEQLGIPEPDHDIGVGSGSHAIQTAKAMVGVEEAIRSYRPRVSIALGDTNTVLATAIASVKSGVPFAHVEAGLRSWNMTMPEEVNRVVIDHVSQLLFAPSSLAMLNLLAEGIPQSRAFLSGNTIVDVLTKIASDLDRNSDLVPNEVRELSSDPYILATVHRQENTDDPQRLRSIVKALLELSQEYRVLLPLHPRTRKRLLEYGLMSEVLRARGIHLLKPLGYIEFVYLLKNALVVLTDSGGVQEEAFTLRVPTVTLRYNTERPETVLFGGNVLAGADTERIIEYTTHMIRHRDKIRSKLATVRNPYGEGDAARKIVKLLDEALSCGILSIAEPDLRDTPYISYAVRELSKIDPELDEELCYIDSEGNLTIEKARAVAAIVRTRVGILKPWESLGC